MLLNFKPKQTGSKTPREWLLLCRGRPNLRWRKFKLQGSFQHPGLCVLVKFAISQKHGSTPVFGYWDYGWFLILYSHFLNFLKLLYFIIKKQVPPPLTPPPRTANSVMSSCWLILAYFQVSFFFFFNNWFITEVSATYFVFCLPWTSFFQWAPLEGYYRA